MLAADLTIVHNAHSRAGRRGNARSALRERKRNHRADKDHGNEDADNLNLLLLKFDHE